MKTVNIEKIVRLSNLFVKKASGNLLNPGESTITFQMATDIAKKALMALGELDDGALSQFPHANFKELMQEIIDGNMPDNSLIEKAIQEFNSGLRFFANMHNINVPSLRHIM